MRWSDRALFPQTNWAVCDSVRVEDVSDFDDLIWNEKKSLAFREIHGEDFQIAPQKRPVQTAAPSPDVVIIPQFIMASVGYLSGAGLHIMCPRNGLNLEMRLNSISTY